MKTLAISIVASVLATALPAATFDFSGNICNIGSPCGNSSSFQLDQTYGDFTGVDAVYDRDVSTAAIEDVYVWTTGYESFGNAIWTDAGAGMSVSLIAQAGYDVILSSLGFAPYLNRNSNTQVRIVDLATSTDIFDTSYAPLSTAGITTVSPNATSSAGFQIFFGPDAFNAGIGSLTYSTQVSGTPAVPLPASGLLLLAGLGGLIASKRKRS